MNDDKVSRGTSTAEHFARDSTGDLPEWPKVTESWQGSGELCNAQLITALRARLELAVGYLERLHRTLPGKPIEAGTLWETIVACREPK